MVPDGRWRKFRMKFHNSLVTDTEYIHFFVAPLIEEMEVSPLSLYYGMDFKIKQPGMSEPYRAPFRQLVPNPGKKYRKKIQRGDAMAPYFEYNRYWPWVLCSQMEAIPWDSDKLDQIADSIPAVAEKWSGAQSVATHLAQTGPAFMRKEQKKMRKLIQKHVCDELEDRTDFKKCVDSDDGAPDAKMKINQKCGVWPKEYAAIYKKDGKRKRTIKYRIHPAVTVD